MTETTNPIGVVLNDDGTYPAYAWPGGYAIAYLMNDGVFLCASCVNDDSNPIHFDGDRDGWLVIGYMTADWHDEGDGNWTCAHCEVVIHAGDDD